MKTALVATAVAIFATWAVAGAWLSGLVLLLFILAGIAAVFVSVEQ